MTKSLVLLLATTLGFMTLAVSAGASTQCELQPPSGRLTGAGRVRGTLTFFFNEYQGTKPDVGAVVALVPGQIEIPNDSVVLLVPGMLKIDQRQCYLVASSLADGSGNFEFDDVATGEYTAVMVSAHVKGGLHDEVITTNKKGKPLKQPKVVQRPNMKDMGGRVFAVHITVQDGKTIDASSDFGISLF